MRLTNTLRTAFVRAVMNDVPEIDYPAQWRKAAKEAAISMMPDDIRRAYKKHPDWFSDDAQYVDEVGAIYLPIPRDKKLPNAATDEIRKLSRLCDEQRRTRRELSGKLQSIANGCTTKKALVAALPEFEKYLPADEAAACRTLPVVANVVADFVKAGWPKSEKPKLKVTKRVTT